MKERFANISLPHVFLLCGSPGVGKSTVATELNDAIGGKVFATDNIRKELFDDPQYTASESERTYSELWNRAEKTMQEDTTVILDGTFSQKRGRDKLEALCEQHSVPFTILFVTCEESVVKQRIKTRLESEDAVSDADYNIYRQIRSSFAEIEREFTTIDTTNGLQSTREQLHQIDC